MRNKLFTRDFSLLWLGKSVSQLGDGAGFIGLMWWIQSSTGSASVLGLMVMISTLIRVFLSPFSGVVADKFNKKTIMVLTDTMRGLVYCLLAYLAFTSKLTIPLLLTCSAINAVNSVFFGPAISATVPLLVTSENLPRANSFMQMTSFIVSIVSYTAGGLLVTLLGLPLLLIIDGVSFLLSALSETFINIPHVSAGKTFNLNQFAQNIREGFDYVKKNHVLFEIMKVAALLNFVAAPTFILLPKFVNDYLGAPASMYGYLLAASMVGTLCASLIIALSKIVERNVWMVMHSITVQGALFVALVLIPKQAYYGHLFLFGLVGFANGICNVYFSAIVQRVTAKEHMGKVFGLMDTMGSALQPISQGLSGLAGDRFGIPLIFGLSGASLGAGGVKFSLIPNLKHFLSSESAAISTTTAPAVADD